MPPAVLNSDYSNMGNERVELKFNKVQAKIQLQGTWKKHQYPTSRISRRAKWLL